MPETQDAIDQRRRIARSLMMQGTSAEPVGHWTQAAARVAQALSGGYGMAQADTQSKQRETFDTQQAEAKQGANRAYAEGATQREVQQKMQLAQQAGLQPGSPEFKQYVYGIKTPDPRESQLMDLKLQGAQLDLANAQRPKAPNAPEVRELVDEQGNNYTAQWTGNGWERIGGVKRKPSVAEDSVDRAFAKTYEEDFASGAIKDQEKNVAQLKAVRDGLIDPKGPNVTGPIVGRISDFVNSFINPKAVDTRERVEEVVQRNLRVILGAQFTEEEGKRLIARAYNPTLPEAVNAQRLTNLATAMDGALRAKKEAAQYFEREGTLRGFKGPTAFTADDIATAIDSGGTAKKGNALDLGDGFTVEVEQ
jgi:hypothetical protein